MPVFLCMSMQRSEQIQMQHQVQWQTYSCISHERCLGELFQCWVFVTSLSLLRTL